jgi:hypothetical protein
MVTASGKSKGKRKARNRFADWKELSRLGRPQPMSCKVGFGPVEQVHESSLIPLSLDSAHVRREVETHAVAGLRSEETFQIIKLGDIHSEIS